MMLRDGNRLRFLFRAYASTMTTPLLKILKSTKQDTANTMAISSKVRMGEALVIYFRSRFHSFERQTPDQKALSLFTTTSKDRKVAYQRFKVWMLETCEFNCAHHCRQKLSHQPLHIIVGANAGDCEQTENVLQQFRIPMDNS